jgi:uncharacterized Zn finger protein (UPF0148 family)
MKYEPPVGLSYRLTKAPNSSSPKETWWWEMNTINPIKTYLSLRSLIAFNTIIDIQPLLETETLPKVKMEECNECGVGLKYVLRTGVLSCPCCKLIYRIDTLTKPAEKEVTYSNVQMEEEFIDVLGDSFLEDDFSSYEAIREKRRFQCSSHNLRSHKTSKKDRKWTRKSIRYLGSF